MHRVELLRFSFSKRFIDGLKYKPFTSLGLILLNPIIDRVVDATVTPKGLNLLLNFGQFSGTGSEPRINNEYSNRSNKKSNITLYYKSFNKFVLSSQVKRASSPIIALWVRHNYFHWRLSSITIPDDLIRINLL